MRIAFLGNGMTGYLDAQYRELHRLGHELLVVQPGSPDVAVGAMRDTAFGDLGVADYAEHVSWSQPPVARDLVARVARFAPDAVVMTAWNFDPAYRATMRAQPSGVVRIMVMDNLWRSTPRQWLARATKRWYLAPVADVAMVPGDRSETFARKLGFGPADVIRGSLSADTTTFTSEPRTADELASRRRFLYVGRLVEHKGADFIATAYARYRTTTPDPWELHVVGMGPLDGALRGQPGVVMHGFVAPADVADLMRQSSAYVLPSIIEPYGVSVHEAVACGLPVLCSEFSGAGSGFIQDGANGWLLPAGDVARWSEAMGRMSAADPVELQAMSDISRSMSRRTSPAIWARNLAGEIARRLDRPVSAS